VNPSSVPGVGMSRLGSEKSETPTALGLGREGWKPFLEAARQRRATAPPAVETPDRERLLARLREVAAALKTRFGAHRVVLFGSLAHGAWFMPDSDVDLAVEGVGSADYWEAWRLAEEIIGDRSVDLIELETAGDSLRRAIERHGIEL